MFQHLKAIVLVTVLASALHSEKSFAQGKVEDIRYSKDSIKSITKEAIVSDLEEYKKGIARNHVNPFTLVKRRYFNERIDSVRDNADKMDVDQLFVEWLKINALLQDEHTNIVYRGRDVFPLGCYWFDEGIYIVSADNDNKKYLYAKIVAVNGMPIEQVTERIFQLVPDKNKAALMAYVSRYLFNPFIIHGLGISPSRTDITYTIVTYNKETKDIHPIATDSRTLRLPKMTFSENNLRASRNERYWFKYIDSGKYLYFNYSSCYDDKKHPFKKVEETLLETIENKKPNKIIIDLRDNGGGHPRQLSNVIDRIARSDLNKKGGIYVLIGRNTFSAAILNSVAIHKRTYATLIGEETAGSVVHFGFVEYFSLPATNLKVVYSTRLVITDENYDGSLRPDVLLNEEFSDYMKGIDGTLEYAIQH